jgi:hypothetical protein
MLLLALRLARTASCGRARDLAAAIALSIVFYAMNGVFVTAYTLFFGTLLLTGFLPGCLLVLDRAEKARPGTPSPG